MTIKITLEQRRIEAMRAYYAQFGVSCDKATRRLFESFQEESRPTVKLLPVASNMTVLQIVSPK